MVGVAGVGFTVTERVCAVDAPHPLFAVTVTFPLVAETVVVITVELDEPDHPEGNVHV